MAYKIVERGVAIRRLRDFQPAADDIRHERGDKCPSCKRRGGMYSYALGNERVRGGEITCGFYCGNCGWGGSGSRENLPFGQWDDNDATD